MKGIRIVCMLMVALVLSGCSVNRALNQPGKKDLSLMRPGVSRSLLLAEFGRPVHTEEKDGKKMDVFSFVQGYSGGVKAGRALLHGAADVYTLGLWEVVGNPAEGALDGKEVAYEVHYTPDDKVDHAVLLKKKAR